MADQALAELVIAMDGTAGAGKSTASRGVATTLGLRYLDTGAMYRAVTLQALNAGVRLDDSAAVCRIAEQVLILAGTTPTAPTITLDGVDVSADIRSARVTGAVSQVSAVPRVREVLVEQQRREIGSGGIVVEGRDIGTVVAPNARLKVYLTADPGARARRRTAELTLDHDRDLETVQAALLRRDASDSGRAAAPLSAAADAVVLDSTYLTLPAVVETIVGLARDRVGLTEH
ncbi:MAG: (d)CMP kinase [Nocardioidaceae bacterium]